VLENRLLRRIFGSKRDYVAGGWRTLHKELNFIRMIKSRKMRWAGHVTHLEEKRCTYS
jgi:hypothetical protein